MAFAFFRLLYTILTNPGYIPRGDQWSEHNEGPRSIDERRKRRRQRKDAHRRNGEKPNLDADIEAGSDHAQPPPQAIVQSPTQAADLEAFYAKDVFVCQPDGRPKWCSYCLNWKPDRTRHCSEVDRCVLKMDHFCPWYA